MGNDDIDVPQTKIKTETDQGIPVKPPCSFPAKIT
jgi:hypothetical protein